MSTHPGRWFVAMIALLGAVLIQGAALAGQSAVVFMYHRFGEGDYPSTSIRLEQFEAHLTALKSGGFTVWPVPRIVAALKAGEALPDRTVGITIDDAYLSVFTEAWPRFKAAGIPFTVFVATDPVDRKVAGYMTWDQLRELKADGVTIGSQTIRHPHMPRLSRAAMDEELAGSNARFMTELGERPMLFAYPYGEASLGVMEAAKAAGFEAAFGQHSGVADDSDDLFYLPRFALNETYGDLSRFQLAANALPLPARDLVPLDPTVSGVNPPPFGFSVPADTRGLAALSCYSSHEGKLTIERLGDTRIEVRMEQPLPTGRTRINCTMPTNEGRWRWFGRQLYVAP